VNVYDIGHSSHTMVLSPAVSLQYSYTCFSLSEFTFQLQAHLPSHPQPPCTEEYAVSNRFLSPSINQHSVARFYTRSFRTGSQKEQSTKVPYLQRPKRYLYGIRVDIRYESPFPYEGVFESPPFTVIGPFDGTTSPPRGFPSSSDF